MGRHSRQKGKRGEREAVKIARDYLYADRAWRTAQFMGKDGGQADVQDVLPGFHVEVKWYATMALYGILDQAVRDMKAGELPLLMLRADKRPWMLCIRAEDVDEFVNGYLENKASGSGGGFAAGEPDESAGR